VSLAIGYEVAATPLQIAVAYGAIANDGVLLAPTLVREVRDPEGEVLYRHRPEPVRRVVSLVLARQLRQLMRGVVEHGTGAGVTIAHFDVAAKTGTARRTVNGRYAPGEYVASLATLFPADEPQIVVVVKVDGPDPSNKKKYFAAQTAAPVTRSLLERALASRTVTLNRARVATTPIAGSVAEEVDDGSVPYVVPWPFHPDTAARRSERQLVPDVSGLSLRAAARTLHRRGFRVVLRGWGMVDHTAPAAGAAAATGSAVTVFAAEPR
jgi:cell division protein FtsI (penicillin-binding protein 3)